MEQMCENHRKSNSVLHTPIRNGFNIQSNDNSFHQLVIISKKCENLNRNLKINKLSTGSKEFSQLVTIFLYASQKKYKEKSQTRKKLFFMAK